MTPRERECIKDVLMMGLLRMLWGTPKPIERLAKNHVKPLGDLIEAQNNILDSVENVTKSLSVENRIYHAVVDDSVEKAKQKYKNGDHIATYRSVYSHHGIYDGEGNVYEYQDGSVMCRTIEEFAGEDDLYTVNESSPYSPDEIVARARSRVGESEYNLLWNNCENFATWCRCGAE